MPAMKTRNSSQIVVIGVETFSRLAPRPIDLNLLQFRSNRAHDARGHSVLKLKNVLKVTLEPINPKMCAGRRINELSQDPHPVARFSHATFERVTHAQVTANLTHILGSALVCET